MTDEWKDAAVSVASIGMAAGLYILMLGKPLPMGTTISWPLVPDPLAGLVRALAIGLLIGLPIVAVTTAVAALRVWRSRLAIAAGGLYLAGTLPALGNAALVLAPAAALAWLGLLALARRQARAEAVLLVFHAGTLGTALCFFHQWPRYRACWQAFAENLRALLALWF